MPTKGNTGQSRDSTGILGSPSKWKDTGYTTPNQGMPIDRGFRRGNVGFGTNNDFGALGRANTKSSPYASGNTAGPSQPQVGYSWGSVKNATPNSSGTNDVGLGRSQKPGRP